LTADIGSSQYKGRKLDKRLLAHSVTLCYRLCKRIRFLKRIVHKIEKEGWNIYSVSMQVSERLISRPLYEGRSSEKFIQL
jgi:hypothetical protein